MWGNVAKNNETRFSYVLGNSEMAHAAKSDMKFGHTVIKNYFSG